MVQKNIDKQKARKQRVQVMFNTGTRTFKNKRDYDRRNNKISLQKVEIE